MKFNGPAPEIINGRLAMLGIVAAAVNEANYSEPLLQQVPHNPFRIMAITSLVTYSSLIPILKGAKSEAFGETSFCQMLTATAATPYSSTSAGCRDLHAAS